MFHVAEWDDLVVTHCVHLVHDHGIPQLGSNDWARFTCSVSVYSSACPCEPGLRRLGVLRGLIASSPSVGLSRRRDGICVSDPSYGVQGGESVVGCYWGVPGAWDRSRWWEVPGPTLDAIETILQCPVGGSLIVCVAVLVLLDSSYLGLRLAESGIMAPLTAPGAGRGEGLTLLLPCGSVHGSVAGRRATKYAGASRGGCGD